MVRLQEFDSSSRIEIFFVSLTFTETKMSLSPDVPPTSSSMPDQHLADVIRNAKASGKWHSRRTVTGTPASFTSRSKATTPHTKNKKSHRGCKNCKHRRVKVGI